MSDSAVDHPAGLAEHALVFAMLLAIAGCSATDRERLPGHSDPTAGSGAGASGGSGALAVLGGSGGEAPSSGGSAGSGTDQALDAGDDVYFVWPETPPGTAAACLAGVYQGTFECTYLDAQAGNPIAVNGPISLRLVQSQQGEFLEVRDGTIDGTGNVLFLFHADISGELDCRASKFTGTLLNGTYSGLILINGTFTGVMNAGYDHTNFELVGGTWQLAVNGGTASCAGTWSASYFGP